MNKKKIKNRYDCKYHIGYLFSIFGFCFYREYTLVLLIDQINGWHSSEPLEACWLSLSNTWINYLKELKLGIICQIHIYQDMKKQPFDCWLPFSKQLLSKQLYKQIRRYLQMRTWGHSFSTLLFTKTVLAEGWKCMAWHCIPAFRYRSAGQTPA